jgi:hypothetical protein
MSDSHSPVPGADPDRTSALFANLVIQQTNLALMLLGRVPNPETGEQVQDLDSARLFIDQLEMLEVKTKGNLDAREDQLLKQSLMTLRMAYVEASESGAKPQPSAAPASTGESAASPEGAPAQPGGTAETAASEEERRKKFTKKY